MGLTEAIVHYATGVIDSLGYWGVFALMIMESMFFPLPSEAVMPFAGYLVAEGRFTMTGVVIASTLGSIVGSLLSYAMGFYGGRPLVNRFGRYVFFNEKELEWTERFFQRRGSITVFIGRFIPVMRHFISIPPGMAKMHLFPFLLFTTLGAGMWNGFLAWTGVLLRQNWEKAHAFAKPIDYTIVVLAIIIVLVYIYQHIRRSRRRNLPHPQD